MLELRSRSFFLINTAEERGEALDRFANRLEFCHQRNRLHEVSQPLTRCRDSRLR